jgi:hypothetical protein
MKEKARRPITVNMIVRALHNNQRIYRGKFENSRPMIRTHCHTLSAAGLTVYSLTEVFRQTTVINLSKRSVFGERGLSLTTMSRGRTLNEGGTDMAS